MKLEMYLQNSNDGVTYDISGIAQRTQVSQTIEGEAGKLTTILQKDPNNLLKIANGSPVSFIVDGKGFFFGYVFRIGTDAQGNYKITCYDKLRYLKNSDIYVSSSNQTASDIFEDICKKYQLKYNIKVATKYKPKAYSFKNKSLYTIIKRGMDLASINDKKKYFILDDFGTITWSEISAEGEQLSIQLGDGSLVTSFTYEKSIDEDTFNQIKLYRENKEAGKIDVWIVKDGDNQKRWGILQYLKEADDSLNGSQVREAAENYLKVKNRETETLKLQAEGVIECIPGKRLKFVLPREGIDKWMWIKSSTHTFTKEQHTMDLEVEI